MGMSGIAKYMHFSKSIDLRRESERALRLPDGRNHRSVLMSENRAATFPGASLLRISVGGWLS